MESALIVKKSSVDGTGVFAGRDFEVGETICMFGGQRVSVQELRDKIALGRDDLSCDSFQLGEREYLLLDEPYVYVNHSCVPNAGFKNETEMVALVDIKKGDELFFDYSTTEWTPQEFTEYDYSEWPMPCRCGTVSCRRLVTCFVCLPEEVRERHLERGVLQDYIKEKASRPLDAQRCYVCEEVLKKV